MTDQTTAQPLTDQQLDEIDGRAAGLYEYATGLDTAWQAEADQLAGEDVPALLAEIRRLHAVEAVVVEVRAKHKPRTERHGSGCVQCGIVWPCPTHKALDVAVVVPAVEAGE